MTHRQLLSLVFVTLALFVSACDVEVPSEGRLVIIGGGLSGANEPVYQSILQARQGEGPICVIPTAGASPESSMRSAVSRFENHGGPGAAEGVLISEDNPEAAHDPAVVATLNDCGGFFFTGGQQSRIARVFRPDGVASPAFQAVAERHAQGAVVSGTSAGAAIMSDPMISGGSSAGALERGVEGDGVRTMEGLGFLADAAVDQHFLARGRIGRLLVAVLQKDEYTFGFGIDENTALAVEGDSVWTVGESGVVIVEGHEAVPAPEGNGGTGLRLYLLGDGDGYDMRHRRVFVDPAKQPLQQVSGELDLPDDIYARWALLHVLDGLARTDVQRVVLNAEGYDLILGKAEGFQAHAWDQEGVQGTPGGLTVGPFTVDLLQESGG